MLLPAAACCCLLLIVAAAAGAAAGGGYEKRRGGEVGGRQEEVILVLPGRSEVSMYAKRQGGSRLSDAGQADCSQGDEGLAVTLTQM